MNEKAWSVVHFSVFSNEIHFTQPEHTGVFWGGDGETGFTG